MVTLEQKYGGEGENMMQWGVMGGSMGLQGRVCICEDVIGEETGAI